jgi:HEAT repeat protein
MLAAVLALLVAASPDPALRAKVNEYLGAIHGVSAETWRALGPDAAPLLEEALARAPLPSRRAAAAAGLAAIGGERARTALVARARAEEERFVVRAAAIRGAERVVPAAELPRALEPALSSRSREVRAVAAEALAGTAEGCQAVRGQAAREGAGGKERYAKALARCR